jgi:hypothetical protein
MNYWRVSKQKTRLIVPSLGPRLGRTFDLCRAIRSGSILVSGGDRKPAETRTERHSAVTLNPALRADARTRPSTRASLGTGPGKAECPEECCYEPEPFGKQMVSNILRGIGLHLRPPGGRVS